MIPTLPLEIFDLLVFLAVTVPFALLVRRRNAIPRLPALDRSVILPRLSVVVPARDEASGIGRAVESLLAQDYPDLEIIAVDDRSSDATGAVLAKLAARDSRIRAIRVDQLPAGWLGKNHALWRGAESASGEWLLFTDADIVFAQGALRRAVAYAVAEQLDHLTLAPRLLARGLALRAFVAFFAYTFIALWGAYLANDPKSTRGVGIGAFNLVRRSAYARIGTMRALSLRPDDDIRLGRRLRGFGFRQRVLNGNDFLSVEWYPSLRAAISGLEKSMYSSLEYRLVDAVGVLLYLVATMVAVRGRDHPRRHRSRASHDRRRLSDGGSARDVSPVHATAHALCVAPRAARALLGSLLRLRDRAIGLPRRDAGRPLARHDVPALAPTSSVWAGGH